MQSRFVPAAPVAIVAAGCVLPGAHSVEKYWTDARTRQRFTRAPAMHRGRTAITPGSGADRPYTLRGGYVVDEFRPDPARMGVRDGEIDEVNPMQWVTLEAGAQAAEGIRVLPRARTAVLVGSSGAGFPMDSGLRIHLEDLLRSVSDAPAFATLDPERRALVLARTAQRMDARLRQSSADPVIGSLASVAAARIAARFDLRGAHYALDADHASALAALETAALGLDAGEWDCALVGGASELLTPVELVAYSRLGWLSEEALLGEGAVFFALKRLADARRDGERILAVLTGLGSAAMGSREDNVAAAARAAWSQAGVPSDGVHYVATDGPGISALDASEARGLAAACADRGLPLAVSSAAGGIGHLRAASGAVSLLRAVLAISHGELLPSVRWNTLEGLARVRSVRRAERWPGLAHGGVRRAGVSSIALGGQSFHAVLEAANGGHARVSVPVSRDEHNEPLAIVAMAGIYPGADGIEAFWQGLLEGRDGVGPVPASRWDLARFATSDPKCRERTLSGIGSFLGELPEQDERFDASHALAVKLAGMAVEKAGRSARRDPERVRVYLGAMPFHARRFRAEMRVNHGEFAADLARALGSVEAGNSLTECILTQAAQRYGSSLPALSDRSLSSWLAAGMADAVAERFGAGGVRAAIESACASTLAALHNASLALSQHAADAVVVGAAFCDLSPEFYIACSRFRALSPDGIRPFGASPRGFVPGEGGGIFVLKRWSDARRDGDEVLALVRSVSGSSDGSDGGATVLRPSVAGEALAIERAIERAGILPGDVDYVECHGAGTALGDTAEIAALGATYGQSVRTRALWVGSVKSNLGHLCAAAGAPALTKTILALRIGVIPPTLHGEPRNPTIDFAGAQVETTPRRVDWHASSGVRRAGLSAFGLGGTNFHAILEQPPATTIA